MATAMSGIMKCSGISTIFLAKKYCEVLYILLSCYLTKTYLSAGNVNEIGEIDIVRENIETKNRNPVIEYQDYF